MNVIEFGLPRHQNIAEHLSLDRIEHFVSGSHILSNYTVNETLKQNNDDHHPYQMYPRYL